MPGASREVPLHGNGTAGGAQRRCRRRPLPLPDRRAYHRARPGVALQPDDVYGPSRLVDPPPSPGPTTAGAAALARSRDLRAARRHLHARAARFAPRVDSWITSGARRHGVELMPVADFPGTRNWGYDGVLPFAPDRVRRARRPEGADRRGARARARGAPRRRLQPLRPRRQLPAPYAPQFFTDAHHTPWGAAIDFDGRAAAGARVLRGERALLAGGVPLRRPAPRRRARDPRRLARRTSSTSSAKRARRPGRVTHAPGAGERRQRGALLGAARRARALQRAVERRFHHGSPRC